jgi:hypothetical protein
MQNKLLIIIFISIFPFALNVTGQKLINSPFSRFNIGSIEPAGSFRSIGMGGTGTAMRDNFSIYFSNPASYSSLDTNSFVFDFGIDYSINVISDGNATNQSDDMNFDHLIIGFPLSKGIGLAFGIVPVSNGFYNLYETVNEGDPEYDPATGEYVTYHQGSGGFTNFFVGTGINLNKNFSAGVNMTTMLGRVDRGNQFVFSDYSNGFSTNLTESLQMRGINFDLGLQYMAKLKKDHFLNAGLSLTTQKDYRSTYESSVLKISSYSAVDTISYIYDGISGTTIPATMRFGISYGKKDKYVAAIDYITTKWASAKIPGSSGFLADSRNILFGAEYIPDKFSNYSFLSRMEYRIGAHIGDNYLIINGKQIREYGVSAGLGFILRRPTSLLKTNIFFDLTRKDGLVASGLKYENYYTMGISLNIWDMWFLKRQYD